MNCLNNSLVEGGTGVGAGARVGVKAWETVGKEVDVLLPWVGASGRTSANSSSSPRGEL